MNRFIVAIVVIALAVGGVAYYLGWFNVGSDHTGGNDHVTITVDENKFKEDEKKAKEKVHDLGNQAKDAGATPAGKKPDEG